MVKEGKGLDNKNATRRETAGTRTELLAHRVGGRSFSLSCRPVCVLSMYEFTKRKKYKFVDQPSS